MLLAMLAAVWGADRFLRVDDAVLWMPTFGKTQLRLLDPPVPVLDLIHSFEIESGATVQLDPKLRTAWANKVLYEPMRGVAVSYKGIGGWTLERDLLEVYRRVAMSESPEYRESGVVITYAYDYTTIHLSRIDAETPKISCFYPLQCWATPRERQRGVAIVESELRSPVLTGSDDDLLQRRLLLQATRVDNDRQLRIDAAPELQLLIRLNCRMVAARFGADFVNACCHEEGRK